MYIFSQDQGIISAIINNTSSGNILVNDVLLHAAGIFTLGRVVKSFILCIYFDLSLTLFMILALLLCINISTFWDNIAQYIANSGHKHAMILIKAKLTHEFKCIYQVYI